MSPKTWMTMVYFQRYLELEKLARLGVGYLTYLDELRSWEQFSEKKICEKIPGISGFEKNPGNCKL